MNRNEPQLDTHSITLPATVTIHYLQAPADHTLAQLQDEGGGGRMTTNVYTNLIVVSLHFNEISHA